MLKQLSHQAPFVYALLKDINCAWFAHVSCSNCFQSETQESSSLCCLPLHTPCPQSLCTCDGGGKRALVTPDALLAPPLSLQALPPVLTHAASHFHRPRRLYTGPACRTESPAVSLYISALLPLTLAILQLLSTSRVD